MGRRSGKMREMRMAATTVNMAGGHARGHLVNIWVRVIIWRGWADVMRSRGTAAVAAVG